MSTPEENSASSGLPQDASAHNAEPRTSAEQGQGPDKGLQYAAESQADDAAAPSPLSDAEQQSVVPPPESGTTRTPAPQERQASETERAQSPHAFPVSIRERGDDPLTTIAPDAGHSSAKRNRKTKADAPRSYYDVPMLKPPVWKWEIATYFWFGGISGGSYAIARMAERFGKGRYKNVTRAGTAVSWATLLPCAPLLIRDLGDPKRFLYMLRVFKPKSPMNLGSWVLTGFGAVTTLAGLNQLRRAKTEAVTARVEALPAPLRAGVQTGAQILERFSPPVRTASKAIKVADTAVEAVADLAGVPLGLLLAGYTGVLLSTSNTPLWARKNWLGVLFSASALSTGADAIQLALHASDPQADQRASEAPMHRLQTAAKVTEAVAIGGFLHEAGELAAPITKGKYAPHMQAAELGLVVSFALESIPFKNPTVRRAARIAGAVTGLASGLALRWAISQAGHISGNDPQAARDASRPSQ